MIILKLNAFIHLFQTSQGYYLYDVNTNTIVGISEKLYKYFYNEENILLESDVDNEIESLQQNGFLKDSKVQDSKHPATEILPSIYENKINYVILQVTQNCNLRCKYCIYSGNYQTRTHTLKEMSWDVARQSLDYLIAHSQNEKILTVGFYGGEPLLNIKLIKKCVSYFEKAAIGKEYQFVMTTNLTLLDDEIIEFLIEKKFVLTVSIDGPKNVHNKSRIFATKKEGSFDIIINNLKKIYSKDTEYYMKNIQFSTVMTTDDGFCDINNFFVKNELFKHADFNAVVVSNLYTKEKHDINEKFHIEKKYETFKMFLSRLGLLKHDIRFSISDAEYSAITNLQRNMELFQYQELPDTWHHGGPCIPGIKRLFVDVNGWFYPCEKVCETNSNAVLGSIDDGISIEKAEKMLNIERLMSEKCKQCWAYAHCKICIMQVIDAMMDENSFEYAMDVKCSSIRFSVEQTMKDYCVLKELGHTL